MGSYGSFGKKFVISTLFPKGNSLGFGFLIPPHRVDHRRESAVQTRSLHHELFTKVCLFSIFEIFFLTFFPLVLDSYSSSSGSYSLFLDRVNGTPHLTDIVCLGDSLTLGVGASPGHDYPSLLSKALGVKVINAGVDGDETEDALKRLDADVLAKDPSMVIVLLGGNDFLDRVPRKRTFENLDEIIRRIQTKGVRVVLAEIGASYLGNSLQKEYDQIAVARRVPVVPKVYDGILLNPTLKSDKLHPNDKGYKIIAERILRVVTPILKQES